ncbi:MAG: bifunctional 3,4-dihydroxy-2-butanone-4-phosphate synthase/GTP cyclohydrolase II [Gammaproteobacteria bacterium]
MGFSSIVEVLEDLRAGRMIILVDDESRENEGDLVCAAQTVTPEMVNFMLRYGRGLICLTLSSQRCQELQLYQQVSDNTAAMGTAFTISIDAHPRLGLTTGESAIDRALTIRQAVKKDCRPEDLVRPGHVFPVRAKPGGVLVRAGHTEATVDLARLAGLTDAGVICPILNESDGTMARLNELNKLANEHGLKIATIADLIDYRRHRETLIKRLPRVSLPTAYGQFSLIGYESPYDSQPHLALCKGGVGDLDDKGEVIVHQEPVLVRVHSECLTGDVFGSQRCECGPQLAAAMQMIENQGKGALIYLRQEGRGIGLANKLHAYVLQENGLDTVQANQELGFEADRRDYGIGSQILRDLGLRQLRLLTNNPQKIYGLQGYGMKIVERIELAIEPCQHNVDYLKTKKDKLGHML